MSRTHEPRAAHTRSDAKVAPAYVRVRTAVLSGSAPRATATPRRAAAQHYDAFGPVPEAKPPKAEGRATERTVRPAAPPPPTFVRAAPPPGSPPAPRPASASPAPAEQPSSPERSDAAIDAAIAASLELARDPAGEVAGRDEHLAYGEIELEPVAPTADSFEIESPRHTRVRPRRRTFVPISRVPDLARPRPGASLQALHYVAALLFGYLGYLVLDAFTLGWPQVLRLAVGLAPVIIASALTRHDLDARRKADLVERWLLPVSRRVVRLVGAILLLAALTLPGATAHALSQQPNGPLAAALHSFFRQVAAALPW